MTQQKVIDLTDSNIDKFVNRRLPGEGRRAFAAFIVYRNLMPEERTLERAAAAIGRGSLSGWSRRFAWVKRSDRHDEIQADKKLAAQQAALQRMSERHASLWCAIQEKAVRRLNLMVTDDDIRTLNNDQLIKWMTEATVGERKARGLPDTVVASRNRTALTGPKDDEPVQVTHVTEVVVRTREDIEIIKKNLPPGVELLTD